MFPQKPVRVYVLSSYTLYTEVHGKCVIVVYPTIVDLLRHNWLRRRAKTTQATNDIVSFYAVSFGLCVLGFWGLGFFGGFWFFGGFVFLFFSGFWVVVVVVCFGYSVTALRCSLLLHGCRDIFFILFFTVYDKKP